MSDIDLVIYGLGGLMFYQAYVTIRVVRHKSYTSEKKRHQLLIIWLVPFAEQSRLIRNMQSNRPVNWVETGRVRLLPPDGRT